MSLSLQRNTAHFADLAEAQSSRVAEICHGQTYRAVMPRSFLRKRSASLSATSDNHSTFLAKSMS